MVLINKLSLNAVCIYAHIIILFSLYYWMVKFLNFFEIITWNSFCIYYEFHQIYENQFAETFGCDTALSFEFVLY